MYNMTEFLDSLTTEIKKFRKSRKFNYIYVRETNRGWIRIDDDVVTLESYITGCNDYKIPKSSKYFNEIQLELLRLIQQKDSRNLISLEDYYDNFLLETMTPLEVNILKITDPVKYNENYNNFFDSCFDDDNDLFNVISQTNDFMSEFGSELNEWFEKE